MSDWLDDLDDNVDEVNDSMSSGNETDDDVLQFKEKFEKLVQKGEVQNINVATLRDNIDSIDDTEILNDAQSVDERKTAKGLYSERIESISSNEESEEDLEQKAEELVEEVKEEMEEQADEEEVIEEEVIEDMEEEVELEDAPTPDNEEEESTEQETSNNSSEEDMETEETDLSVDLDGLAQNAMTKEEADAQSRRQGIMIWGDPGMGKTHFAYTMPDPVCIIDTEGKSDDISHKFDGTGNGDPFIWQPSDYDGAVQALEEAFDVLERFHEQAGILGTIVVDSMSIMWDWSQQKYVDFAYPTKDDVEEVEFSSSMGRSGESDWKQIKRYHNVKFRQRIIDSPYHFCWTQMRGDDYAAVMEGESQTPPDKPVGEKENVYKANYIINVKEDSDGAPVGNLEKSALTKHNYTGLRYPTFNKHDNILQELDAVETDNSDRSIRDIEQEFDITLIKGNPSYVDEG